MDWRCIKLVSFTTFVTNNLYIGNRLLTVEVKRGMKKKTIVFGSLLAVFLMLMIPNVRAVEYNTLKETLESKLPDTLQNIERRFFNSESTSLLANILAILSIIIIDIISLTLLTINSAILVSLSKDYPSVSAILSFIVGIIVGGFQGFGLIFIAKQFERANQKIISILSIISFVVLELWIFTLSKLFSKDTSGN